MTDCSNNEPQHPPTHPSSPLEQCAPNPKSTNYANSNDNGNKSISQLTITKLKMRYIQSTTVSLQQLIESKYTTPIIIMAI